MSLHHQAQSTHRQFEQSTHRQRVCDETFNCHAGHVQAVKDRLGFYVLYKPGTGISAVRYLSYSMAMTHTDAQTPANDWDYSLDLEIIERRTGKMTVDEPDSTNRAAAISFINSTFAYYDSLGDGSYETTVVGVTHTTVTTDEVDFTYLGSYIVGASITRTAVSTPNPGFEFLGSNTVVDDWSVTLGTSYSDTMINEELDELLTEGLPAPDGVSGSYCLAEYNSAYGTIYPGPALDASSFSGYTALSDPAITITVYSDANAYWNITGQWWQHTGGGYSNGETFPTDDPWTFYDCTFTDEDSMQTPSLANADLSTVTRSFYWFNVLHRVCASFSSIDDTGAGLADSCVLSQKISKQQVVYSPHSETLSNTATRRFNPDASFTCPGALTDGTDCPCVSPS